MIPMLLGGVDKVKILKSQYYLMSNISVLLSHLCNSHSLINLECLCIELHCRFQTRTCSELHDSYRLLLLMTCLRFQLVQKPRTLISATLKTSIFSLNSRSLYCSWEILPRERFGATVGSLCFFHLRNHSSFDGHFLLDL